MSDDALKNLRERIDAIDEQRLELFNQRARCAFERPWIEGTDRSREASRSHAVRAAILPVSFIGPKGRAP